MNKTEKQFKKDFEFKIEKQDINLTFDTRQLEANYPKPKKKFPWKVVVPVGCSLATLGLIVAGCAAFINTFLMKDSGVQTKRMRLSMNEISIAKSNTFRPLNTVSYPDGTEPTKSMISEDEATAYNNFSNLTYHSLVKTGRKENMTYSPVGLYSVLNEIYGSISRENLAERFDTLLGLNEEQRVAFYKKVMMANSFADDESTIQLKNAAFFRSGYEYSTSYVEKLTKLYTMAYSCDFNNDGDVNKMLEWANDAVHAKGFINKDFLELDEKTMLVWFSTLFFKNAWESKYLSKENTKGDFYLANGDTKKVTYMHHSYFVPHYYDYGTYISVKDYYANGNASVTYIVPKDEKDDIFELTKNVNVFKENEDNKIVPECPEGEDEEYCHYAHNNIEVRLATPKFKNSIDFDFENSMVDLGLGDMFSPVYDSFHNAFTDSRLDGFKHYLGIMKQKNQVEFNEDGSVIRSLTVATMKAESGIQMDTDILQVKLNQPFIYIIRDINDTPIFVGHIDNPTY